MEFGKEGEVLTQDFITFRGNKPHSGNSAEFFRWRCVETMTVETGSSQRGDRSRNPFF